MALAAGSRLGPYEILAAIGAGGMGEVYRARDTKLGRDVAIKVLPGLFANDLERLARFQREAQVLASLNHPHIAAIYGLEDSGGVRALVMELVEGPTLADRIAQGPIPLAAALPIAQQIAEALQAAHDQGIIHRDLKPANIKVREDGTVKVLDFGLAKLVTGEASGTGAMAMLSQSPTLTTPAATLAGAILGTAAYMAPEQAKGRPADKRCDVWAFGAVLYEMLTGTRAFEGEDVSDTLAAVLRGEPDWNALPPGVPAPLVALVRGCLQKDRQARVADVSVVRFLLGDPMGTSLSLSSISSMPGAAAAASASTAPRAIVPWAVASVLAVGLALVLAFLVSWSKAPAVSSVRVNAALGADGELANTLGANAVLSPDGTLLVLAVARGANEPPQLYVRRLDQLQASVLAGTERASNPFFSPDGQWVAFFSQGKLKKVAVTGGAVVTLCDAPDARGGAWGEDGLIVFQPESGQGTVLRRVPAAGGTPEKFMELAAGESTERWPQILPGGRGVLFTSIGNQLGSFDSADIVVQPLPSGPRKILQRGGYYGRYLKSGHLLFMHQGTLFAAPLDLGRLEMTGPAAPAIEAIASSEQTGGVQFSASDTGAVVYLPGKAVSNAVPIEWADRTGKTKPLRSVAADWSNPAFSPDGKQLAIDISDGTQADVWTYDWSRDTLTRLTFDTTDDQRPVWTPDGRRIVFASRRGDKSTFNLYWQRADGTGEVQRLTESKNNQFPTSFHPSGKFLAFMEQTPNSSTDLMILPMDGNESSGWKPGKPTVFLNAPYQESTGVFSPDGRWLAYLSNESGRNELFVRPFPGPGGKWQVSTSGADDPTWSLKRHELLFASIADGKIMTAPYAVEGDSFRADKPSVWSPGQFAARPRAPSRDIDLHPDGERFAVASRSVDAGAAKQDSVIFVFNFFDELRRIAPVKK